MTVLPDGPAERELSTAAGQLAASAETPSAARQPESRGWLHQLFAPVDIAPLVFFRVFFGAMMLYYIVAAALDSWIDFFYILPEFHLTYPGFGWVRPWPGNAMYLHFGVMGLAAAGIMLGFCYRLSAVVFWLTFTHTFLIEKALYQNHYYLICLLSALMIFVPAHRAASVDAFFKPQIRAVAVPTIWLWLLRVQLAIPYFYGGLAKLNYDWLHGMPMQLWLSRRTHLPYIGEWVAHESAPLFFAYAGLLYDLLVVPALLWRRTRLIAYLASLAFHLTNHVLWDIGIFPWFMIGATLLFFPPRLFRRVLGLRAMRTPLESAAGTGNINPRQKRLAAAVAVYVAWQLLFPFRHFLYPGNVNWTEEGHHFAWHMMLREKDVAIRFFVFDEQTGQRGLLKVSDFLNQRQLSRMGKDADMILDFVHHVRDHYAEHGRTIQIRVLTLTSLNGRKPQLMIDPQLDYAQIERRWGPQPWIVPLTEPLRPDGWYVPMAQWEQILADQIPDDMLLGSGADPQGR